MRTHSAPAARAKGLVALAGLLLLVVGVPWLLVQIGAGPIPDRWPSLGEIWDGVTTPDDGSVLVVIFRYAAWLAWLFVILSIALEVGARLLGTDVPQLPGLALPQGIARYVVGTAALLFVALPTVGSWATASAAPAPTGSGATLAGSTALAGGVAATSAATVSEQGDASASEDATAPDTVDHEVQQGESLWSIAEQRLGDGARYTEILDLNRDAIPASHWISPGQTLQLPGEAGDRVESDTHTVEQGETLWQIAEDELGSGERYTDIVDATGSAEQPDGDRLSDPDLIRPGWTLGLPGDGADQRSDPRAQAVAPSTPATPTPDTTSPAPTAGADAATGVSASSGADTATVASAGATSGAAGTGADVTRQVAAPQDAAATSAPTPPASADEGASDPVLVDDPADEWGSTALGLSGITAAGLVALLERARRRRAGALGRPGPSGDAELEDDLRLAADIHTAETIDLALRHVAVSAREAGRALPGLRSVRMTPTQLDVQLADPMRLPAPWTSTADPRLWTLAVDRAMTLDHAALRRESAPFPSLVVIGQDDEGAHVLVNLADARTFAVVGDAADTRDTLAAMTLALATAPWSDATTVTVIGGHPELERVIASPRVRFMPDMASYTLSVQVQIDPSAREVIVVSGDLDATDRRRLDKAVASSPRVSLAHAATEAADGADALTIGADRDTAVLSPAYLQLRPQHLGVEDATRLAHLFELAATTTGRWVPAEGEPTAEVLGVSRTGGAEVTIDPVEVFVDDAPTTRRSEASDQATGATPVRWNTPVNTPMEDIPGIPGEDVQTVRRTGGFDFTAAMASTPGWLSNQITPTPGTPLPPVIAFPERVRELAAPTDEPVLRLLGPVDIDNVGEVAEAHRMRLTELAAYLSTHPQASGTDIDDALWPNRAQHDHTLVRRRSLAGLGGWLGRGETPDADTGLAAARGLVSDWQLWRGLVPGDPSDVGTDHLEQALGLVRGRPFAGVHPRHYVWAEALKAEMIFGITTAATELARRRLMEGRWASSLDATVVGLTVEPGVEALWRMQLLAAHELGDTGARDAAALGLSDCDRLAAQPLEAASVQLLETLPQLSAAQTPTTTHHAV